MAIWAALPALLGGVKNLIGSFVKDPSQAQELSAELDKLLIDYAHAIEETARQEIQSREKVLVAEISGKSWMQRSWRPILMLTFTIILANNYIFSLWFDWLIVEFPDQFWQLLKIGVGGYIISRSAFDKDGLKRVADAWKGNGNPSNPEG